MAAYELLVIGDHRSLLEAAAAAAVQLNGMHAASVIAGCGRMCIVNAHSKVNDCLSATTMSDLLLLQHMPCLHFCTRTVLFVGGC